MVEQLTTAPVGLMSLAAFVRERQGGFSFSIIDQKMSGWTESVLVRHVVEGGFGVVGLSCFTQAAARARRLAAAVRKAAPNVTIVVGGPYVSSDPTAALQPEFDFAIFGEGELPFADLLTALADGGDVTGVLGLVHRDPATGETVVNEPPPPLDIDDLPPPAWDLVDPRPYWRREGFGLVGKRPYITLMSSRGCPYRCAYCHNIFGKRFRARSPEKFLAEMHDLRRRFGVDEFEFIDDTFNMDRGRAEEILARIRTELPGARLLFPNGLRADLLDDELVSRFVGAGTYYVSLAVETASPRIQRLIEKNLDLDRTRASMDAFARHRTLLNGFFMLGFPTETREEMEQTVAFALDSPLLIASFFFVMPFPGTALYRGLDKATKAFLDKQPSHMLYDSPLINISAASDRELKAVQSKAIRRFYLRPGHAIRFLRTHPRPLQGCKAFLVELLHKTYARLQTLSPTAGARDRLAVAKKR